MFQIDELVVYPAQGVGRVECVDHQEMGGVMGDFYIVRIVANNVTLMVPVRNAANVGLRTLIPHEQGTAVLDSLLTLGDATIYIGQNWNRRFREYSDKIKSTLLQDVALVVRELLCIGRTKELSFGERRLLEHALNLVTGELAHVLNIPENTLREKILAVYAPPAQSTGS